MPYADAEKRKAAHRRYYERNRSARLADSRERAAKARLDPAYRASLAEAKREARIVGAPGYRAAKHDAHVLARKKHEAGERRAEAEAIHAWRAWLRRAPLKWRSVYWAHVGRPWRDPQLSASQRYVVRWRFDKDFRAREYARLLEKKQRHRHWMSERRLDVTPADEMAMRAMAQYCYLCGCDLNESVRTLDHVKPLSKGGIHSRDNLAPCCLPCNSRKQDKETK